MYTMFHSMNFSGFRMPRNDTVHIFTSITFVIINFSMYTLYPKSIPNYYPIVVTSMQHISFRYVLVAAIALSLFMIIDDLVDYGSSQFKTFFSTKKLLLNQLILTTLLTSALLIFCVAIPSKDMFLLLSVLQARIICMSCVTLVYAYQCGGPYWRQHYLKFALPLASAGFHLRTYVQYQGKENINWQLLLTSSVMLGLSFLICEITLIFWIVDLVKKYFNHIPITKDEKKAIYHFLGFHITSIVFMSVTGPHLIFLFDVKTLLIQEISFFLYVTVQHMYETRSLRLESSKYQRELEFKRMFVRYISHEIRTPLNTAIMGLQLLCENLPPTDEANRETATEVRKSCDVAVGILNELLTFDKLEAGALMLEKLEVNAMALIRETVEPFQVQAHHSGVTLHVIETPRESPSLADVKLIVDPNKIAQVIRNLVSNGLKFTPQGGTVTVSIDIVHTEPCLSLKIDVTDTGAGISVENQGRLFKEIVQFNPGKLQQGGGSGLGLYISNGIVGLHGGKLSVSSIGEGCGCTFTLILPTDILHTREFIKRELVPHPPEEITIEKLMNSIRIGISSSSEEEEAADKSLQEAEYNQKPLTRPIIIRRTVSTPVLPSQSSSFYIKRGKSMSRKMGIWNEVETNRHDNNAPKTTSYKHELNIVVADDSAMNRKMLVRLLGRRCKTCLEAEDGLQVVNMISSSLLAQTPDSMTIDLVVMDSVMPHLSGLEATKRIRDMGFKGLVIGVTGNVTAEDIESFMQHGADAVLPKPLSMEAFDKAVNELIGFYQS